MESAVALLGKPIGVMLCPGSWEGSIFFKSLFAREQLGFQPSERKRCPFERNFGTLHLCYSSSFRYFGRFFEIPVLKICVFCVFWGCFPWFLFQVEACWTWKYWRQTRYFGLSLGNGFSFPKGVKAKLCVLHFQSTVRIVESFIHSRVGGFWIFFHKDFFRVLISLAVRRQATSDWNIEPSPSPGKARPDLLFMQ